MVLFYICTSDAIYGLQISKDEVEWKCDGSDEFMLSYLDIELERIKPQKF